MAVSSDRAAELADQQFLAAAELRGTIDTAVHDGVIARNPWWILGGVIVLAFYGGLLWGLLPTPRVSWLGHVFGAIGGVLAAWVLHGDHGPQDDPATPTGAAR